MASVQTPLHPAGLDPQASSRIQAGIARVGLWLRDHQAAIRRVQWTIIVAYVALLIAPLLAPMPTRLSHIWSNAVLFAQFVFWGIWWPFVLVSMVLVGRSWCGLFCPEGALAEAASRHGLGRAIPHWIKWRGWPFVAFASTTIYGQMVSVYQYPKPVIVVLGGSTLAAMVVGFLCGHDKRVWCRYLCPVNGVFALLSKLAPLHYAVDNEAWHAWRHRPGKPPPFVNCAPLVPIRTMQGASACHMCGRCAGFKQAVALEIRSPSHEIVHVAGGEPKPWETFLIVFGLMGLAAGAFQWASSPLYVTVRQKLAEWLVEHGGITLIEPRLPWWILTNYPDQNDMMTPLDGALMIGYLLGIACLTTTAVGAALALSTRALGPFRIARFHHLAQCLIPMAGCGLFLGLSMTTVTLLRSEGLSLGFVGALRMSLLGGATLWCLWLAWQVSACYSASTARRLASSAGISAAVLSGAFNWWLLFWAW
ncbi:MAG: 4Fe-4S binding protein [Mesorhizobium sp.]|uniref:4Fe-4S binding protein n=1 Tax=unclassified Mesorhizobium TaxID=325217 RepID=UPI000FCA98EE|nr:MULTISPECIES: 4Fe-4S binding protein [unclassified Mesorhizobium]RUW31759.1 4Fe-4S binding protein [Mesorhizobium sp. M1E.F.Ca.ET.041.01.1.1]RUW77225.1 4Fe-4S binding protein [Mesorhizobium sp. M4B.F.Ca.ET.049.02.1.2]TIU34777.1 MAG: 4Fe-4S binding protein [Mesorhizobium sp.]